MQIYSFSEQRDLESTEFSGIQVIFLHIMLEDKELLFLWYPRPRRVTSNSVEIFVCVCEWINILWTWWLILTIAPGRLILCLSSHCLSDSQSWASDFWELLAGLTHCLVLNVGAWTPNCTCALWPRLAVHGVFNCQVLFKIASNRILYRLPRSSSTCFSLALPQSDSRLFPTLDSHGFSGEEIPQLGSNFFPWLSFYLYFSLVHSP